MKTYLLNHLTAKGIIIVACVGVIALTAVLPVRAGADWKGAFEEICGQVQSAEAMSDQEIRAMIEKADNLMPEIQASADPGKKVYLLRLKRCRGVYEFMLDSRNH